MNNSNNNDLWYTFEDDLFEEFNNEIKTANEVILISPYIYGGFVTHLENILSNMNRKFKVKILTSTFGNNNNALDLKGLYNKIYSLNNKLIHVEIKLQIDKKHKIHMKNFIFKRVDNFSTAIIGSSNLTDGGLKNNIELNVKLLEQNEINIFKKLNLYFEKLWNQKDLISFSKETKNQIFNISDALKRNKNNLILTNEIENGYVLKNHQLEALANVEKEFNLGIHKHLIVMATGTGKTVLAAFATKKRLENSTLKTRFLFVAHQKEIINQAFKTYREILDKKIEMLVVDNEFKGDIISAINNSNVNIFITVQKLNNLISKNKISKNLFTLIFYDEVHHYEATTYKKVITFFNGEIFGLTATPQRMDGKNISRQFNDSITYELTLFDAIKNNLLSIFHYYLAKDHVLDLVGVDLSSDKEIWTKMKKAGLHKRNQLVLEKLKKYIKDYDKNYIQGVIYCLNKNHANEVNDFFNCNNLKSHVLTSDNSSAERKQILNDFKNKRINYICVVDLINEGIDIPTINLIIRLRPTNSKTIFLQQLGRGMRIKDNGLVLKVLDFVPSYKKVDYLTNGIQTLYLPSDILELDFNDRESIPEGCDIHFEEQTQKQFREMIQESYLVNNNTNNIQKIIQNLKKNIDEDNFESMLNIYLEFFNRNKLTPFDIYHLEIQEVQNTRISFYSFPDIAQKNIEIEKFRNIIFINSKNIVKYFIDKLTFKIKEENTIKPFDRLLWFILYKQKELDKIPSYANLTFTELIYYKIKNNKAFVNELLLLLNWKLLKENLLDNDFLYNCKDEEIKIPIGLNLTSYQIQHLINYFKNDNADKKIQKKPSGVFSVKNSNLEIVTVCSSGKKGKYQNSYDVDKNIFNWFSDSAFTSEDRFNLIKTNNTYIWYQLIENKYQYKKYFKKYHMNNLYQFLGKGEFISGKPAENREGKSVINFKFNVKQ